MNNNKKRGIMLLIALIIIIVAEVLIGMYFVNKWTDEAENGSADTGASAAVYTVNRVA